MAKAVAGDGLENDRSLLDRHHLHLRVVDPGRQRGVKIGRAGGRHRQQRARLTHDLRHVILTTCDRAGGAPRLGEREVLAPLPGALLAAALPVTDERLLGRQLHRGIQIRTSHAGRPRRGRRRTDRQRRRVLDRHQRGDRLTTGRQRVRLPVVELEPRGLADEGLSSRRVLDIGKAGPRFRPCPASRSQAVTRRAG